MSFSPASGTSVSFEQILSWFGTFTPQLKFKLMALRRESSTEGFENVMRESMFVFRSVLLDLSRQPKGAGRAKLAHAYLDGEYSARPVKNASCASGCSACCRSFPKQISEDDADLLAAAVNEGRVEIDRAELERQAGAAGGAAPCLFLSADNKCRVYDIRPVVCRKYHVTSPRENCETDGAQVNPQIDLMPELIASASLSLPDNGIGFMAAMLNDRVKSAETVDAT